ncbi:MAG: hypothetical protein H6734_14735 [Alphaproteobacteria bacterium]|nr:hypothetical protein [Alphaproteobacteria bacterium]
MLIGLVTAHALIPPPTTTVSCPTGEEDLCARVDAAIAHANAELPLLAVHSQASYRMRPQTVFEAFQELRDTVEADPSCTIDGSLGGAYDIGWAGTAEVDGITGELPAESFGPLDRAGHSAPGNVDGHGVIGLPFFGEYSTWSRGHVIGTVHTDGVLDSTFWVGTHLRTQGRRGVFLTVLATCAPTTDPAVLLEDWFGPALVPFQGL